MNSKILSPKVILMLFAVFFASGAHASEVTGTLSSAGVSSASGGGSEVTGTFGGGSSSGNGSTITGTVTGGGGGSGGGTIGGSVAGAVTGGSSGGGNLANNNSAVLIASNSPSGSVLGASTGPSGSSGGNDGEITLAQTDEGVATTTDGAQISDNQNADQLAAVGASGIVMGAWYWWLLLLLIILALIYYMYRRYKRDRENNRMR